MAAIVRKQPAYSQRIYIKLQRASAKIEVLCLRKRKGRAKMLTIYIRKIRIFNLVYKRSEIRRYKKLESISKLGTSSS